ncbi:uncharacterized protein [Anabrus simplex]|uniref:uncharacterized protein isoform X2 n=1 Tax=Anabrus simplex TaxID=316456 RepID=UPI0035A2A1C5
MHTDNTAQQSSLQSLNEMFLNLERNVKLFLDRLQQWTTDFVTGGLMLEVENLRTVQEFYRQQFLYPQLQVVQRYAKQVEQYEDIFRNFSTPDVWKGYKASRDRMILN